MKISRSDRRHGPASPFSPPSTKNTTSAEPRRASAHEAHRVQVVLALVTTALKTRVRDASAVAAESDPTARPEKKRTAETRERARDVRDSTRSDDGRRRHQHRGPGSMAATTAAAAAALGCPNRPRPRPRRPRSQRRRLLLAPRLCARRRTMAETFDSIEEATQRETEIMASVCVPGHDKWPAWAAIFL